jgi:hypothetical protein
MLCPVIDSTMYEAIGRVTVTAAGLEAMLAHTVCVFLDEDEDAYAVMLTKSGKGGAHHAWLAALPRIRQAVGDPARLDRLALAIENLLDARHRIAHSVAMHNLDTGEQEWWHPKSDTSEAWDLGRVREVARDLGTATGRLIELGHEIATGRQADAAGPPRPPEK